MLALRRAVAVLMTVVPIPVFAQGTPYVTMQSPGNGQRFTSKTAAVSYKGCTLTGYNQTSWQTRVVNGSGTSYPSTNQGTASKCPDYNIYKQYTATATLSTGANTITGDVCSSTASPSCGTASVTVYYDPPPAVSTATHSSDFRDVSRCVANCFEHVMTYSPPAYVSRNTAQSVTLVYRSGSAHPVGTIQLDVIDSSSPPAGKFKLQLQRPDQSFVTFLNGSTELYFGNSGTNAVNRLVAAFDAASVPTGSYPYTAIVTSMWASATASTSKPLRVTVLNEANSPFGAGWTLSGHQILYLQGDGVLATDGTGSSSFFSGYCSPGTACSYTPPGGDFSTLTRFSNGTYQRQYPDGTVANFGADGKQTSLVDRFGTALRTFLYGFESGTLGSVVDAASQSIGFGYEAGGTGCKVNSVRWIFTPNGRTSSLCVDASNHLVQLVDPDNIYFGYADYAADHRLYHFRDRRGGDWDFAYAWEGTLASSQAPAVDTTASGGGPAVRPTVATSGPGGAQFAAIAGGAGTFGTPVQAGLNPRASITNPRGFPSYFTLNRWGTPTQVTTPAPNVSFTYEYHTTTGQLTRSIGLAGHDVRFTWTGANLTRILDASTSDTVNASYESTYNQIDQIWGNATISRWFYYDATRTGKPLKESREGVVTAPLTTYSVDGQGRISQVVDLAGHTTTVYFASGGFQNTDSVVAPGQRVARYKYDGYGRIASTRTGGSATRDSVEYDLVNRTTASIDGGNRRTTFRYDSLFLRAVVDPLFQVDSLVRNALGWVTQDIRPGSSIPLRAVYDVNGNVLRATNRESQVVTFAYDELDRDTLRVSGSDVARFQYMAYASPIGGVIGYQAGSNAEGADTTFFDIRGRVKRRNVGLDGSWYAFDYTFNPNGTLARRDATSNQSGFGVKTMQYAYNSVQSLQNLTAFGQGTALGLNSENLITTITYPNQLVNTLSGTTNHENYLAGYSGSGSGSANTKLGTAIRLDGTGRIKEWRRAVGDSLRLFNYDSDGTLSWRSIHQSPQPPCTPTYSPDEGYYCASTEPVDHVDTYTYDDAGNFRNGVITMQIPGNRVLFASGVTYGYDLDGNLTSTSQSGLTRLLSWNALGQLVSVTVNGSTTVGFGYDAFGRRVRKTVNGIHTRYVHEWENLFLELTASGAVLSEYANWPGIDSPHSVQRFGQTYYFAFDPVSGNVRGLIRASDNAVMAQYGYTPFGVLESGSFDAVSNPIRYAGREYDIETGLYYFRARYYDPERGRFISEDPIGIAGGFNLYAYVSNDPINGSDPSGMCKGGTISIDLGFICITWTKGEKAPPYSLPGKAPPQAWSSPLDVAKLCQGTSCYQLLANWGARTGRDWAVTLGAGLEAGAAVGDFLMGGGCGEYACGMGVPASGVAGAFRRFTPDQAALIELAKSAKRAGGLTQADVEILRAWAREYKVLFRGPEAHVGRPFGQFPHIHVGPISHIPVIP